MPEPYAYDLSPKQVAEALVHLQRAKRILENSAEPVLAIALEPIIKVLHERKPSDA